MLTNEQIDLECAQWANLAIAYATTYLATDEWTRRQVVRCANRIIALRSREAANVALRTAQAAKEG